MKLKNIITIGRSIFTLSVIILVVANTFAIAMIKPARPIPQDDNNEIAELISACLETETNPLIRAICERKPADEIKRLSIAEAFVNSPGNYKKMTPLMWAAILGDTTLVHWLIENRANLDATDENRKTATIYAVTWGQLNVLAQFLRHDSKILNNPAILFQAVEKGHAELASFLIERGADPAATSTTGYTLLMAAARSNLADFSRVLLEKYGAEPNARTQYGWTALNLAAQAGSTNLISLLIEKGAEINAVMDSTGWCPLLLALRNGHGDVAALLVEKGANINIKTADGWTALLLALDTELFDLARLLIDHGADVNATHANGYCPLLSSLLNNNLDMAKLLCARGAQVNIKDRKGATPLMYSASIGNVELAGRLLDLGAEVNAATDTGTTALMFASRRGHQNIASLLIEQGANVNAADSNGTTALMLATRAGSVDLAELLLLNNANVDDKDNNGTTALMLAADSGHVALAKLLKHHGANMMATNNNGETALLRAVKSEQIEMVEYLLECGVEVNATDQNGNTVLATAIRVDNAAIVDLLINHGADVNGRDNNGMTALMLAARFHPADECDTRQINDADILKSLYKNGAEIYLNNASGQADTLTADYVWQDSIALSDNAGASLLSLSDIAIDTTETDILLNFTLSQQDSSRIRGTIIAAIVTATENDTIAVTTAIDFFDRAYPVRLHWPKPDYLSDFIHQRLFLRFQNETTSQQWLKPIWNNMAPWQLELISQPDYLAGSKARFELQVTRSISGKRLDNIPVAMKINLSDSDSTLVQGHTNEFGIFLAEVDIPAGQTDSISVSALARLRTGQTKLVKKFPIRTLKEGAARTFVTTDRDLYKPGQIIHIRTLTLRPPKDVPVAELELPIELIDPSGNSIFKQNITTNKFGIASTDFQLGAEVNLGDYTINLPNNNKVIKVNDYMLPYFDLSLTTDKQCYLTSDLIIGELKANYFYGKPVAFAGVNITIKSGYAASELIAGTTDANGCFQFSKFYFSFEDQDNIQIDATVTDNANHLEQVSITRKVTKYPIHLQIVAELNSVIPGIVNKFYLVATSGDQKPVATKICIRSGTDIQKITTNANGFASFEVQVPATLTDSLLFSVLARDKFGVNVEKYCLVSNADQHIRKNNLDSVFFRLQSQALIIRTDEDYYCQGEPVNVTCISARDCDVVTLDFFKEHYWLTSVNVPMVNKLGQTAIKLDQRYAGLLTIMARPGSFSDDKTIRIVKYFYVSVGDELNIKVIQDKAVFAPGEQAALNLSVTDRTGIGQPAAIALNMVDQRSVKLFGGIKDNELEFFKSTKKLESLPFYSSQISHKSLVHQQEKNAGAGYLVRNNTRFAFTQLYKEKPELANLSGTVQQENFNGFEDEIRAYQIYLEEIGVRKIYGAVQNFIANNPTLDPSFVTIRMLVATGYLEPELARNYRYDSFILKIKSFARCGSIVFVKPSGGNYNDYDDDTLSEYLAGLEESEDGLMLLERKPEMRHEMFPKDYLDADHTDIDWIKVSSGLSGDIRPLPAESYASLKYGRAFITGDRKKRFWFFTGAIAGRIIPDYRQPEIAQPPVEVRIGNHKTVTDSSGIFSFKHLRPGRYELVIARILDTTWPDTIIVDSVFPDTLKPLYVRKGHQLNLWVEFPCHIDTATQRSRIQVVHRRNLKFDDIERIPRLVWVEERSSWLPSRSWHFDRPIVGQSLKPIYKSASKSKSGIDFSTRKKPRGRENFPETMYWNPSIITDETGHAKIDLQIADSITDWDLYSSAVSQTGQLGSTVATLRVFQDFFIDVDLPIQLTRYDQVAIPVAVYNFLDKKQTIELELEGAPWFTIFGDNTKKIQVKPEQVAVVYFDIRVEQFGTFDVRVNAYGSDKSDAIIKSVQVVPEGQHIAGTTNGRFAGTLKKTISFPEQAIAGTEKILIKLYPGAMSQILDGLEGLLKKPYGCFEQSSSITYPNLVILDYLRKTGQSNATVEQMAQQYVNWGYQKMLSYEVDPAGFSLFGQAPANLLLTAYGLMIFSELSQVQYVDPKVIKRTWYILSYLQHKDGYWQPIIRLPDSDTGRQNYTDLVKQTAFILWALLESRRNFAGADSLYPVNIAKGIQFIQDNLKEIDDPYPLALCANVFYLWFGSDHSQTRLLFNRLLEQKIVDGNDSYWQTHQTTITHSRGTTANIETTALVGYVFARARMEPLIIDGIRSFLIKHRNQQGDWGSTQATVMTMKMLLASYNPPAEAGASLVVSLNGQKYHEINLTPDHSVDIITLVLDNIQKSNNDLSIDYDGSTAIDYQLVTNCHIDWNELSSSTGKIDLSLELDKNQLCTGDTMSCRLRLYNSEKDEPGMVVARVNLPPYFDLLQEDLRTMIDKDQIERYEMKGQQLVLYLDKFDPHQVQLFDFRLTASSSLKVSGLSADVYEYYQPENTSMQTPIPIHVSSR